MRSRWNTVVIDPDPASRRSLRLRVEAAGGTVVGEFETWPEVAPNELAGRVDVAIGQPWDPRGPGPAVECPLILVTDDARRLPDAALLPRAVMAVLVAPVKAAHVRAAIEVALARFAERRDLEQRLRERKTIERAKGRVMERWAVGEDEAFRRLRRAAMDSRRRLADVARDVLAGG